MENFMEKEETKIFDYLINVPFEYREKLGVSDDMCFGSEIEFALSDRREAEKVVRKVNTSNTFEKKFYKFTESNRVLKHNDCNRKICEVKTPILNNTKEDFNDLKKICDGLKKLDIVSSNQRGVHIHVDLSTLEDNTRFLKTFLKLFCIYEHIIFRFSYGEDYESNINITCYSRELSNRLYKYLKKFDDNISFDAAITELRDLFNCKSYALNFHKKDLACKNDTIEFRTFNSTTNPVIIQNDINFALNMIEQTINNNIDLDLLDYRFSEYDKGFYRKESYSQLNLGDAIEFSDMIFNNNEDRDYFLRQYTIKTHPKIKKLVI